MANLIIKPTSGGSLILQDEGGDAALTVNTAGNIQAATTLGVTGNTTLSGSANNIGTTTAGTYSGSFAGTALQPMAKAWVNLNGTGTIAIRDSYGVSSITDTATGYYTVNLSTATTTNAAPVSSGLYASGNLTSSTGYLTRAHMTTTTAFTIYCQNVNESESTNVDFEFVSGILFGD